MIMRVPPGAPHVLRFLLALSVPVVFIYICSYFVNIPTWALILLQVVSVPAYVAARLTNRHYRQVRAAARYGAVLPPAHNGKQFANFDVLVKFQNIYKNGYPGDGLTEVHAELGGTFNLAILWDTTVITNDANIIKAVLATDFSNFIKGKHFQAFMYSVLGTGVFNADVVIESVTSISSKDMQVSLRNHSSSQSFVTDASMNHDKDEAIIKMKQRLQEGHAVDFQDLISRFTLDSATEFLFGVSVNSQKSPLPYPPRSAAAAHQQENAAFADQFVRAFSRVQDTIAARGRLGYIWPFLEIFSDKTADDMKVVDSLLNPILEKALEHARNEKSAGLRKDNEVEDVHEDDTFLDHLVRCTTDKQVLHDEILNLLIAGRDTTAGTLTFSIYFLCMYPDILARLRREILEAVGPYRRPDYDDIKDMKYLRAFLNEVMRLYPAVPFNVRYIRYSIDDTTVPNPDPNGKPFFVPAGTPVTYSVLLMHRRTDYWGEDAHVFDPDRFLDDRIQLLLANPFIFLPFNAGPRICLGQQFAYNEMSFFLIRLLQNFSSMDLRPESQDPATLPPKEWSKFPGRKGIDKMFPKSHLTAYANGGMWVSMKEADVTDTA
ncbi:hypothetical protein EUX98_g2878 [Antrodiella citrinella]|uniref:Cytochrome P450 n=1 Tax=Antrodiella citrinella TaxID=2447956 RepID=A0A4S4N671_9APHY|nr:hypothetical protein EUX98_g2878 [Antrodiella citrinella]